VALFLSVLAAAARADEGSPAPRTLPELQQQLDDRFRSARVPGANVVLIENGAVSWSHSFGYADVAAETKITRETLFRAGSITKSLTAIGIMILVDEGALRLESNLSEVLPELRFVNQYENQAPLTVAHLLEHTTGWEDFSYRQWLIEGHDLPLDQTIQLFGPHISRWPPGKYYSYSNVGAVLAGRIVEKASGMSYVAFMRARIFEPLTMRSARFDRPREGLAALSHSYRPDGRTQERYVDTPAHPAVSLIATAEDIAKIPMLMLGRGALGGVRILSPAAIARIERSQTLAVSPTQGQILYGLGNAYYPSQKAFYRGHDGGVDGFQAIAIYAPEKNAGLVVLTNGPSLEGVRAYKLAQGYLARDWPDAQPVQLEDGFAAPANLSGYYQPAAARLELFAPVLALGQWHRASFSDGRLQFDGKIYLPVGQGLFRTGGLSTPSLFVRFENEGITLTGPSGAFIRATDTSVFFKALFAAAYSATLIALCAYTAFLVPRWWARGLPSGRVVLQSAALLPILMTGILAVLAAVVFADERWAPLGAVGRPSAVSLSLYLSSLLVPASWVFAWVAAWRVNSQPKWLRVLALWAGFLALIATAYMWGYGWIGVRTWA
jgi:CubicO group peptidase (beta-lactamase class C family)